MKALRSLAITLAAAAALCAAAEIDLPTRTVNGKLFYYYEVPPKQTIYSITRTFGISREELLQYNPQVRDGLRAGDTLLFPVKKDEQPAPQTEPVEEPVEEPAAPAEPEPAAEPVAEPKTVSEPEAEPEPEAEAEAAPEEEAGAEEVSVAVLLPFMLDQEQTTRQSENQTNFYRGMLLAVDSLAPAANLKIRLLAADTEGSPAKTLQILRQPDFGAPDFIIAPGDSISIERIAEMADDGESEVINLFSVKNDAHLRHESVIQANITHDRMYDRAIDAFCKEYRDRKVLILEAEDIPADKSQFTSRLIARLQTSGIPYEKVRFSGKLAAEDLAAMPVRDYVAVPAASSREMLMKIVPSLVDYAASVPTATVSLFGYPEWVTIRGDLQDKLHSLSTVVYSRFSTDLDGADVKAVNDAHRRNYGSSIPESLPNTTLLGFDTMAWIISVASNGLTEPFTGVQNSFRIVQTPDAGTVNDALYFITFTPSGAVSATAL